MKELERCAFERKLREGGLLRELTLEEVDILAAWGKDPRRYLTDCRTRIHEKGEDTMAPHHRCGRGETFACIYQHGLDTVYRGTSRIRKRLFLGPYSRAMPRK